MSESVHKASGQPAFSEPLHVGRPNICNPAVFLERAQAILGSRWLTNHGPMVVEFEKRIAEFLGVDHCVCVCNATVGLEIAIRAAGLEGEVIVPSFTFVATAHALQWQEITPVFADIDPCTHNIDPNRIECHITSRTTGILATHMWGRACAVEELERIAAKYGLALMFDAAHAFGCTHRGRRIGGFGLAEVFSFHATKFLNSFEGGAITTNDAALAEKIRLMTNFGFSGYDTVIHLGTNGKMTEICAAMGLTNLEGIDGLVTANRANYEVYRREAATIPGVRLLDYAPGEHGNYQYIVMEVDRGPGGRDGLVERLSAQNVLARKYFWPGCHRMQPYASLFPDAGCFLPETERVSERVLVLPTGNSLGGGDVSKICELLRGI